jgi:hypothetical protein
VENQQHIPMMVFDISATTMKSQFKAVRTKEPKSMKQATKNKYVFLFDAPASHAKECHHTQMQ